MEECVFYHSSSSTLIVTDLVENFSGKDFNYWQRVVAKGVGILAPKENAFGLAFKLHVW